MSSKGNYYKYKTKLFLQNEGYQVEFLEHYIRYLDKKNNKVKIIKKDIFGSDLIAMNDKKIIFVQVKLGKKNIAGAVKEFNKYKFPKFVDKWIVIWEKGSSIPEIQEC
ncbi:MAG: hypothetical protein GYA14_14170 [Ignavibacteria bacterium]|nr:hypothetical protein [Ignavibacteria bacterium]